MKIFYDLHLHSALSPCGDDDMTPNNIVNFAELLGFDVIALTDHNSCLNIESLMKVALNKDLIIIPGMEVETVEEIHVVCLFPSLDLCRNFAKIIEEKLNKIPNQEKIFGPQLILNEFDEEIGRYKDLLITSTKLNIYELVELVKKFEGIAIPAHIDRASHSIISNLGFIPPDLNISLVEFSTNVNPENFLLDMKRFSDKDYDYIVSSDAHYLEHMKEPKYYWEFEEFDSKEEFLKLGKEKVMKYIIEKLTQKKP